MTCVCGFLFAYRPSCFFQFGVMLLGLLSIALVLATLIRVPFLWGKHRAKAFVPFVVAVIFLGLAASSVILGGQLRLFVFRRRLPAYQEIVRQMEAGQITLTENRLSPVELPPDYNHLAQVVLAECDPNGVVTAEFIVGGGFPVKHSGFLYRSDGHPERWRQCDRWRGYLPVEENWYMVSD